ncbi:MAG: C45 family peptidase [Oscillospiraceae bacterium]|nr:C45 family peptidase [Oscillospiraceae bacterium]
MEQFYVQGSHRTIGARIGEVYRCQVRGVLDAMKVGLIPSLFGEEPYALVAERFDRDTGAVANFKAHAGTLLQELEGISASADVALNDLVILNCMDELCSYSVQRGPGETCTCIGVKPEHGSVLLAQNLDASTCFDGFQLLLQIAPDDAPEQLLFTIPGLLGFTGVNRHGVAVVPNALTMLDCCPSGTPVTLVVRGILCSASADEAASFVRRIQHGAAQNYTIADPRALYGFECSADSKQEFTPRSAAHFCYLAHTNHPLLHMRWAADDGRAQPYSSTESSRLRLVEAEKVLSGADSEFTREKIVGLLTSHVNEPNCICRHGLTGGNMTLGSVIYELSEKPVLYIAPGPGCSNTYRPFTFCARRTPGF